MLEESLHFTQTIHIFSWPKAKGKQKLKGQAALFIKMKTVFK